MKLNKMIVGVLGSFLITTMGVNTASAAAWCSSGTISEISVQPQLATSGVASKYVFRIDCDDTNWTNIESNLQSPGGLQFIFTEDVGVSGYTTALTSISLGKKVRVNVQARSWNSLATMIFMLDN